MDLVFGSGGDAILDDDDEVTHRPLKEPVTEAEDARRLLQLLALRGLGVGCARFIAPAAGEVQGIAPVEPASRDRFGGMARSNFGGQLFLPPRHTDACLVVEPLTGSLRRFGNKITGREKAPTEMPTFDIASSGASVAGRSTLKGKKGGIAGAGDAASSAAAAARRVTKTSKPVGMYKAQQDCPNKYFEAVRSPDTGCIYAIPADANRVMVIDPSPGAGGGTSFIGPDLGSGRMKWSCGAYDPVSEKIFCAPHHQNMVLCIDPKEKSVYPVGVPLVGWSQIQKGEAKFLGAVASHGKVFFFPGNASRVLCFDPATNSVSALGDGDLEQCDLKYGGACAVTVPVPAEGLLAAAEGVAGAANSGGDAKTEYKTLLVAAPRRATKLLVVDPVTMAVTTRSLRSVGDKRSNSSFRERSPASAAAAAAAVGERGRLSKFLDAVVGADGRVYLIPHEATVKQPVCVDIAAALRNDAKEVKIKEDGDNSTEDKRNALEAECWLVGNTEDDVSGGGAASGAGSKAGAGRDKSPLLSFGLLAEDGYIYCGPHGRPHLYRIDTMPLRLPPPGPDGDLNVTKAERQAIIADLVANRTVRLKVCMDAYVCMVTHPPKTLK